MSLKVCPSSASSSWPSTGMRADRSESVICWAVLVELADRSQDPTGQRPREAGGDQRARRARRRRRRGRPGRPRLRRRRGSWRRRTRRPTRRPRRTAGRRASAPHRRSATSVVVVIVGRLIDPPRLEELGVVEQLWRGAAVEVRRRLADDRVEGLVVGRHVAARGTCRRSPPRRRRTAGPSAGRSPPARARSSSTSWACSCSISRSTRASWTCRVTTTANKAAAISTR